MNSFLLKMHLEIFPSFFKTFFVAESHHIPMEGPCYFHSDPCLDLILQLCECHETPRNSPPTKTNIWNLNITPKWNRKSSEPNTSMIFWVQNVSFCGYINDFQWRFCNEKGVHPVLTHTFSPQPTWGMTIFVIAVTVPMKWTGIVTLAVLLMKMMEKRQLM